MESQLKTSTGQRLQDIVLLYDSLYGFTGPMPQTWEEFEELSKKHPQLEDLYQQFF
jgi:hypothetical protein